MTYTPTIGLEIHAELKTKTKMFCSCRNDPSDERPNVNICPICLGHPGTLPVINKEAVKNILKIGLSVGGQLPKFSEFDRKNYFYPDIPKGYQISQYQYPLVLGGELAKVKLTRVHLEEDTARSTHASPGQYSLVDFNRAGLPLMELVTEPVIKSAKEALNFSRELQLLLQYLKVAEANMEKGEMRVEANVSVSSSDKLGTKTEIKNLNSFRSVERAIEYEIKRQIDLLEKGEKVRQETRGWDEDQQVTFSQRGKEESHDYRYFPEPDLPELHLSDIAEFSETILRAEMLETPNQKRARYKKYDIRKEDLEFFVYNPHFSKFFEEVIEILVDSHQTQKAANYIISDLVGMGDLGQINPQAFSKVIEMLSSEKISSRGAKDILKVLFEGGGDPEIIVASRGLLQISDDHKLESIVNNIIQDNPQSVAEYKSGNTAAIQFLVGQGMKITRGSANPQKLKIIFEKLLKQR